MSDQGSYLYGFGRPVLYGEYPYYRAAPARWAANLAALAEAGVDVVTCYLPWRFHETAPGTHDFTGETDPQRDVVGLLGLIRAAGLKAVLKPGPFVHGEVQLGGLPDRVSPSRDDRYAPVLNSLGEPVTSQAMVLPSASCPEYTAQVREWLTAVDKSVLAPALGDPVVGVQLGNEGVYSDANQAATAHDFSPPAVRAFAEWLGAAGEPELADTTGLVPPRSWPPELRTAWAVWGGETLRAHYALLADCLSPQVRAAALVNLPLPALDGPSGAVAAWLARTAPLAGAGFAEGYTSWVGNAARSRTAFASHWFGVRARRSANVEDNWGFTWTDPSYARPQVPLHHALLALGLGSVSCSAYTACSTGSWGGVIDLDPAGLRAEGLDPADYAPPYCPGAPLREDGTTGPNLGALHALRDLLRGPAAALADGHYAADLLLLAPRGLAAAQAWRPDGSQLLPDTVKLAEQLMNRHQYRVDVATELPDVDADPAVPWLVPVDGHEDDEELFTALADRQIRGGAVVLLSAGPLTGRWADWPGPAATAPDAEALLPLLPPPALADPGSGPGTVLVHENQHGRPVAVFAFNPGRQPTTVRRRIHGTALVLGLAPGGAALLDASLDPVLVLPGPDDTSWTPTPVGRQKLQPSSQTPKETPR